jgi:DNA-directed RNA polymerase specialized sigma24 family protein
MHNDPASEDMPTLFRRLADRDGEAFGEICRRLWDQLLVTARFRIRRHPELVPVYDDSDAVGSGLRLFWLRFMQGHVVPPDGVDDFLRLARVIIRRRITAKLRELRAAKRSPSVDVDADPELGLQGPYPPDDMNLWPSGLDEPDTKIVLEDLERWLLSLLGSELNEIAEARIDGKTIDQIAKRMGKSRRTIERMLQDIRAIWSSARRDL